MFAWKFVVLSFLLLQCRCFAQESNSFSEVVNSINDVGNGFFNLVLGDSRMANTENMKMDFSSFWKQSQTHIGLTVLVIIGFLFMILTPIVGFIICILRCFGRCGSKTRHMNPPNARCKRITYGLILFVITIIMIFGATLTLINSFIITDKISNPDEAVNIMSRLKLQTENLALGLKEIRLEVEKSSAVKMDDSKIVKFSDKLKDYLDKLVKDILELQEYKNFVSSFSKVKTAADTINNVEESKYIKALNTELSNLNKSLNQVKDGVTSKLTGCTSTLCSDIKMSVDKLSILSLDQDWINNGVALLEKLSPIKLEEIEKNINKTTSDMSVDLKLKLKKKLGEIQTTINNEDLMNNIRTNISSFIQLLESSMTMVSKNIPAPLNSARNNNINSNNSTNNNSTIKIVTYKQIQRGEKYRFFATLGIVLLVLIICFVYLIGLCFGTFGSRPTKERKSLCKKSIGSTFVMIGVSLSFVFGWLLMLVVLISMVSLGSVQSSVCYHTLGKADSGPEILDNYIERITKLVTDAKTGGLVKGMLKGLVKNCENQSFYLAFSELFENHLAMNLGSLLNITPALVRESIMKQVIRPINMVLVYSTEIDSYIANVSTVKSRLDIGLPEDKLTKLLEDIKSQSETKQYSNELNELIKKFTTIKNRMNNLLKKLNDVKNQYAETSTSAKALKIPVREIAEKNLETIMAKMKEVLVTTMNDALLKMYSKVGCAKLRVSFLTTIRIICKDCINFLNGTWYGIGIFLLFLKPAIIFAMLLDRLYRKSLKYFPDKTEPDYDNYLGFFARNDVDRVNATSLNKNSAHRGYRPIPMN